MKKNTIQPTDELNALGEAVPQGRFQVQWFEDSQWHFDSGWATYEQACGQVYHFDTVRWTVRIVDSETDVVLVTV